MTGSSDHLIQLYCTRLMVACPMGVYKWEMALFVNPWFSVLPDQGTLGHQIPPLTELCFVEIKSYVNLKKPVLSENQELCRTQELHCQMIVTLLQRNNIPTPPELLQVTCIRTGRLSTLLARVAELTKTTILVMDDADYAGLWRYLKLFRTQVYWHSADVVPRLGLIGLTRLMCPFCLITMLIETQTPQMVVAAMNRMVVATMNIMAARTKDSADGGGNNKHNGDKKQDCRR